MKPTAEYLGSAFHQCCARPLFPSALRPVRSALDRADFVEASLDLAVSAAISTPRPSHRLPPVPGDARSVLMHADNGGVDHLDSRIMSRGECIYDTTPYTSPSPTNEAVIAGGVGTERIRQIAPGRSRSQDPENAVENTAVVHPRMPRGLLGRMGLMTAHS
jgi:hypothetical protein